MVRKPGVEPGPLAGQGPKSRHCGQTANNDADTVAPEVTEADAKAVDTILARHSMTAESFRDLMYDIAADEKMSADFERARKR